MQLRAVTPMMTFSPCMSDGLVSNATALTSQLPKHGEMATFFPQYLGNLLAFRGNTYRRRVGCARVLILPPGAGVNSNDAVEKAVAADILPAASGIDFRGGRDREGRRKDREDCGELHVD